MGEERENIEIRLLMEAIYQYYGFDFRDYALSSIKRRVWHRIRIEKLQTISGLMERVLHDATCMERLLCDFSINTTEMFRDYPFFLALREMVIPVLREYPFIRIWHAGCSCGEEVLSIAILLQEEGLLTKTRIYATDMNAKVLTKARTATYPLEKMKLYTKNYQNAGGKHSFSEYYAVQEQGAIFQPSLIKNVIYAQHNLATDTSFNEFQLIICRNVLIYFNRLLQERVHKLFYDSLCSGGFLGLGSKEGVAANYVQCYQELSAAAKLYRKYR